MSARPARAFLLAVSVVAWAGGVLAHEPIFGVGPHTVSKGGLAVEVERVKRWEGG